jgi:hypothetical protein
LELRAGWGFSKNTRKGGRFDGALLECNSAQGENPKKPKNPHQNNGGIVFKEFKSATNKQKKQI